MRIQIKDGNHLKEVLRDCKFTVKQYLQIRDIANKFDATKIVVRPHKESL